MAEKDEKRPRKRSAQERRAALRDNIWPGSRRVIWRSKGQTGFVPLPRVLPLVAELIRATGGKGDPTKTYMDLWFRCFDDGYVQISNPQAQAFAAGYRGTRAVRTWKEHMLRLAELQAIFVKGGPANEFKHVLLVDPLRLATTLKEKMPDEVPEDIWLMILERVEEIGASIPRPKALDPHTPIKKKKPSKSLSQASVTANAPAVPNSPIAVPPPAPAVASGPVYPVTPPVPPPANMTEERPAKRR